MSAIPIIWIFSMRILMILTALVSYFVNKGITSSLYGSKTKFDFEQPLTNLVWITSIISIAVTFWASYMLLGEQNAQYPGLWWALCHNYLVRHNRRRFDSGIHKDLYQYQVPPRPRSSQRRSTWWCIPGHPVRFCGRQLLRILGRTCDPFLMFIAYMVSQHASILAIMPPQFVFAACFRVRPCGFWFSRHGSHHNRR